MPPSEGLARPGPGRVGAPRASGAASCRVARPAHRPRRLCLGWGTALNPLNSISPHRPYPPLESLALKLWPRPSPSPKPHKETSASCPPPAGHTKFLSPRGANAPHFPTPRSENTSRPQARRASGHTGPTLLAPPRHGPTPAGRTNVPEDPYPRRRAPPPCSSPDGHPVTSRTTRPLPPPPPRPHKAMTPRTPTCRPNALLFFTGPRIPTPRAPRDPALRAHLGAPAHSGALGLARRLRGPEAR